LFLSLLCKYEVIRANNRMVLSALIYRLYLSYIHDIL